jgi:small subunit ribosomal protein S20
MRTAVKQLQTAIDAGDADQAKGMLNDTLSLLDRTAKLGAMHTSAADRKKSRLTVAVNKIGAAQ